MYSCNRKKLHLTVLVLVFETANRNLQQALCEFLPSPHRFSAEHSRLSTIKPVCGSAGTFSQSVQNQLSYYEASE